MGENFTAEILSIRLEETNSEHKQDSSRIYKYRTRQKQTSKPAVFATSSHELLTHHSNLERKTIKKKAIRTEHTYLHKTDKIIPNGIALKG